MNMQQFHEQSNVFVYITRFYLFLKDRDAKIIELLFLGFNLWVLVVFAVPQDTFNDFILTLLQRTIPQLTLVSIQLCFTALNITALIYDKKYIRIITALVNVAYMLFCATG